MNLKTDCCGEPVQAEEPGDFIQCPGCKEVPIAENPADPSEYDYLPADEGNIFCAVLIGLALLGVLVLAIGWQAIGLPWRCGIGVAVVVLLLGAYRLMRA